MSLALLSLALVCYVITLWSLCPAVFRQRPIKRMQILGISLLGGSAHLVGSLLSIFSGEGVDFSLFLSGSLIFSVTIILISLSSLKRPLHSMLLIVEPIAILLILASIFTTPTKTLDFPTGTAAHVVFSVLAYGVITIAACCALVLYYSNYLLKHKQIGRKLAVLPPMETIDKLLFEMILAGELLLTLSIVSGFLFVEDFFAQRLAHKTFFSLVSWAIFGLLILGHYKFGWRGAKAIKWTLTGFTALLLAYVGSKFVIEWILG